MNDMPLRIGFLGLIWEQGDMHWRFLAQALEETSVSSGKVSLLKESTIMGCICVICSEKWGFGYISLIVNYIKKRPALVPLLLLQIRSKHSGSNTKICSCLLRGQNQQCQTMMFPTLLNIIHTAVRLPCVDLRPSRVSTKLVSVCKIIL